VAKVIPRWIPNSIALIATCRFGGFGWRWVEGRTGAAAVVCVGCELVGSPAHPFYAKLNEVLAGWKFDAFVEDQLRRFMLRSWAGRRWRGIYFRLLLIGYFEGIDSERGIAWRCADSLSLRSFVGYQIDDVSADHSTISRTRRLIDLKHTKWCFSGC